jgi:hypothetical protein
MHCSRFRIESAERQRLLGAHLSPDGKWLSGVAYAFLAKEKHWSRQDLLPRVPFLAGLDLTFERRIGPESRELRAGVGGRGANVLLSNGEYLASFTRVLERRTLR